MSRSSSALVEPLHRTAPKYRRTYGDEVADLGTLAGLTPDPEQREFLDDLFAVDKKGGVAAFEAAVIACRQNLKTGVLKIAALGWLFITDERLVVWSAHEFGTAQEAFRDMKILIESTPELDARVKQIHNGNGDEAIELLGDRRLIFKARTKGGGRGLTGDKVVLDEAFALQPAHMGALLPTLSARPDPQVIYASSAGLRNSEVLRGIRDRGRSGKSTRLAYTEYGVDPGGCEDRECSHSLEAIGCALDDEDNWQQANPALGRRIKVETVRAERQAMPPMEFARERLGWWEDPGAAVSLFGDGLWERCSLARDGDGEPIEDLADPPPVGAIAISRSIDLAWTSIAAAGRWPDQRVHLGAVRRQRGTSWTVEDAARIQRELGCAVVVDGKGPAASLIPELEAAGVRVIIASTADVLDGWADMYDAVQSQGVTHYEHGELDEAVLGAEKRAVGDRWAVGRKTSAFDPSMLESAMLARRFVDGDADGFNVW